MVVLLRPSWFGPPVAESHASGFQSNLCAPLLAATAANQALLPVFANYTNTFAAPVLGGPLGYKLVQLRLVGIRALLTRLPLSLSSTAACQNVTIDEDANWRQWWWQTCAELGISPRLLLVARQSLTAAQPTSRTRRRSVLFARSRST